MKKLTSGLLVVVATILTAVAVALTYHLFENAVHNSINIIWNDWFATGSQRLLLVPVCLVLTLAYFYVQHKLDRPAETTISEGLGQAPKATISNYIKILGIGFVSLVAGASLGPEAILVPACLVVGAYIGSKLFKGQQQLVQLMSALGFVALFAAFFHSFIAGMLGLVLIGKQTKAKLSPVLVVLAAVASVTTVIILNLVDGSAYVQVPTQLHNFKLVSLVVVMGLVLAGFVANHAMNLAHRVFSADFGFLTKVGWWARGLVAGAGLSALYLLGGPLVEFTGNQSIAPMLQQAAGLGAIGLLWILGIKLLAIAWSKALGYRGGLIFPSVFAASVMVALVQLYVSEFSFIIGLIAVLVGLFVADAKTRFLL